MTTPNVTPNVPNLAGLGDEVTKGLAALGKKQEELNEAIQKRLTNWIGETFAKKVELNTFKAEANLLSGGFNVVKLEKTMFDLEGFLEERKLKKAGQTPEQLFESAKRAQSVADKAMEQSGKAMNGVTEVKQKLTRIQRQDQENLHDVAGELGRVEQRVEQLITSLGGI